MIPDINLITKREKKSDTLKIVIIIAISLVLISAIVATVMFKIIKTEMEVATREQQRLQEQLMQHQAIHDELVVVSQRSTLQNSVTFIESVSYPVSPIIDTTEKHLVPNSYLLSYAFAREEVTITVMFESISDASQYVAALVKDEHFTDVQLTEVTNLDNVQTRLVSEDNQIFDEILRYKATITMTINQPYLAGGGEK